MTSTVVVSVVVRSLHAVIVFQSLRITPVEEEHIHLESDIDEERENEYVEQRMEPASAECTRHCRSRSRCSRRSIRAPHLTSVLAFPVDISLGAVKLDEHDNGADGANDDQEGPAELAYPSPEIRSVGEGEDIDDCDSGNCHANAPIDVPFRVGEEQEATILEEGDASNDGVKNDDGSPGDGTSSQWQHKEAVVTPHDGERWGRRRKE